jgi:uncharacterized protein YdcH (DUF465 family)
MPPKRENDLSTLPPQIPELPISWEDSFPNGNHTVDPAVILPLEPYDESVQLNAPRGIELHTLLEEDAAQSAAYTSELSRLQSELSRHTRDTTEMVKYLEAEVRRKDLMGKRMTRQLADLRTTHQSELALMQKHFENTGKYMEKIFMDKERQMLTLNNKLETQIKEMSELSTLRTNMAAELESTKKLIFANERAHKVQLDALEKKFLAARDGLQSEAAGRIAASRATYKLEVGRELEEESAAVRSENEALRHALKLHEATSDRLQREHASLTQKIYSYKQDLELRTQQNEEYLKKAQRQTKQIDKLTGETADMESQLLSLLQETDAARIRTDDVHQSQIDPLQTSITQARLQAGQLDTTNKSLRRQARRALKDKKEVEQFFLFALEETREMIRRRDQIQKKERALLQAAQLRELTLPASLRTKLPAISGTDSSSTGNRSSGVGGGQGVYASTPIALTDLTLSEREKVLRLLYAKMTHIPSGITVTLPPHSFATDDIEQTTAAATAQLQNTQTTQIPFIPLLALPDTPIRPISAATSIIPQLTAPSVPESASSSVRAVPSSTIQQPFEGASYDSTFLTNFGGDEAEEDEEEDENEVDDGGNISDGMNDRERVHDVD